MAGERELFLLAGEGETAVRSAAQRARGEAEEKTELKQEEERKTKKQA